MQYISQIAFLVLAGIASYFIAKRVNRVRKNILLGKPAARVDKPKERIKTMLLVAFGQKKMFKSVIPAFLHLLIYVGFVVINLEVLEFIIDGLTGHHRFFAPVFRNAFGMGSFYTLLINVFEFLSIAVLFACAAFLFRRNVLRVKRFHHEEMKKWPTLDANLILVIEIILMFAILIMNATDSLIQGQDEHYPFTGSFFFSSFLKPLFEGLELNTLIIIERFAWWFHIAGILAFSVYVTYSKHLHIALAFPNTFYANLKPKGEMENMPVVTHEVKMMLGMPVENAGDSPAEAGRFGAKDVNDLSWVNIMNAYSCTECGRCTSQCPANLTGKKLSPRKIMMDVRDRAEEVGKSLAKGGKGLEDGKSLLGDYTTPEEVNACTSCNACVEACPINIDPLAIILQMRRYTAMEESGSPASWNSMFQNVETSFSPWKFAPTDRFNWAYEMKNEG